MTQTIGFIGLGIMGFPMAGHLASAGYRLQVFNRTTSRAEQWQTQYPGHVAKTPAEAAAGADYVFTCVGEDKDLFEICQGDEGILSSLSSNAVLIDHTTASPAAARKLAALCTEQDAHFLDAPVSGGQAGADNGQLTIMVGGNSSILEQATVVMQHYAKAITHMGDCGSGQSTKMVNQICAAGLIQALAEGLHFSEKAGLDGEKVIQVMSQGAAQSWQMDNRAQTMLNREFDFGFAVKWMQKDLRMLLSEAKDLNASLPITQQISEFYADVSAHGGSEWDTSSLITRLTDSGAQEKCEG